MINTPAPFLLQLCRTAVGRAVLAGVAMLAFALPIWAEPVEVALKHSNRELLANLATVDGKTKEDPIVLMVHGTFAHKDMELMQVLQTALEERGIASLAITLSLGADRRKGPRDCNLPITDTYGDGRAEISAWVKWLKQEGYRRVVLLGHSRGGARMAEFLTAEKIDPIVTSAVLLAPATEAAGRFEREFSDKLSDAEISAFQKKLDAAAPGELFDLPSFLYCRKSRASAAAIRSYYGAEQQRDTPTILKSVQGIKVLVIAAGADAVITDLPEKMSGFATSDTVVFKIVEDADHMFLDFFAEDAADHIAAFVQQPSND